MKTVFLIGLFSLLVTGCASDNVSEPDTTVPEFLIGATYVYQSAGCENEDPIANSCYASIAFPDRETVDILPFGDAIYTVNYRVEDKTLTVLFSGFFDNGIDQEFIIVSEVVFIDALTENQYVRQ